VLFAEVELPSVSTTLLCTVPTIRLMKTLRRFQNLRLLTSAIADTAEALPVLIFTLLCFVLIFSSLIYAVEPRDNVPTLPMAMWLTISTVTTVGYGDKVPQTDDGRIIVSVLQVVGVLYMAMPLGIVGQAFTSAWNNRARILLMKTTRTRLEQFGYSARDIPEIFKQYDLDGNGELDLEEFRQLILEMRIGLTDERVVKLFEAFDADGGGTIDDKEFVRLLFPRHFHEIYVAERLKHTGDDDDISVRSVRSATSIASSVRGAGNALANSTRTIARKITGRLDGDFDDSAVGSSGAKLDDSTVASSGEVAKMHTPTEEQQRVEHIWSEPCTSHDLGARTERI